MILGFEDESNHGPASNENDEENDSLLAITAIRHVQEMMIVRASIVLSIGRNRRCPALFDGRLHWYTFLIKFGSIVEFKRHIRMSSSSFNKLVELLRPSLEVNTIMAELRGGPICPEICVYACIRFLAGGLYTDIRFLQECLQHPCIGLSGNASVQSLNVLP